MPKEPFIKLVDNEDGVVLVVVLLFLVAAIILGVTLIRSTAIELRIAGNERVYNQNFYQTESAVEIVIPQFDAIVSATALEVDNRLDISDRMPAGSMVDGADVGITLVNKGTPPISSGSSASRVTAYYYKIDATMNSQGIEAGVWKAFPSSE